MSLNTLVIRTIIFCVLSSFSINASSQNQADEFVSIRVEEPPQYKKGEDQLSAVVPSRLLLKELKDGQIAVFKVFISKEGIVSDVQPINNPLSKKTTKKLMVNLKKTSGEWLPGRLNGKVKDMSVILRIKRNEKKVEWDI